MAYRGAVCGRRRRRGAATARRWLLAAVAAVSACCGAQAIAQGPPLAPVLPEVSPLPRIAPPPITPAAPSIIIRPPSGAAAPPGAAAVQVTVKEVVLEGGTVYKESELAPLYSEILGKTVPAAQIFDVAAKIEAKYRSDGYILTRVVVPAQEIASAGGTVRLVAVEGYINEVKLDGDVGDVDELIYRYLVRITEKRPVNISDIERYVLLANGIPGITVRPVLQPATGETGASRMIAQVSRKRYSGYFTYDNRGSGFLGPDEFALDFGANSFTSFGEHSEVTVFNTFTNQQTFGQVSTEGAIGSDGVRMRFFAGYGVSFPSSFLALIGYEGDLMIAGATVSYPVILSRALSLYVNGTFDNSSSTVAIASTANPKLQVLQSDAELRSLRIGPTLNFQDEFGGSNLVQMQLHRGLPIFDASTVNAKLQPRPDSSPQYTKFTGQVTRLQHILDLGPYSTDALLSAEGQYSPDLLFPTEQLFLGGSNFGRGYYYGEITGDTGFGTSVELRLNRAFSFTPQANAKPWQVSTQLYTFFDYGAVFDNGSGQPPRRDVKSVGLGTRVAALDGASVTIEGVRRLNLVPDASNATPLGRYSVYLQFLYQY